MGISPPNRTPARAAYEMKLGGFSKVPDVIKDDKRHLDRTSSSGFTRWSFLTNTLFYLVGNFAPFAHTSLKIWNYENCLSRQPSDR